MFWFDQRNAGGEAWANIAAHTPATQGALKLRGRISNQRGSLDDAYCVVQTFNARAHRRQTTLVFDALFGNRSITIFDWWNGQAGVARNRFNTVACLPCDQAEPVKWIAQSDLPDGGGTRTLPRHAVDRAEAVGVSVGQWAKRGSQTRVEIGSDKVLIGRQCFNPMNEFAPE